MKDIPSDILEQFRNMLKKRLIPVGLHSYYLKWLRYYLDYCSKYHLPETSSKSLQQFLQKLLEKKQTEEQRGQAGHAVSLYLDLEQGSKAPDSIAPDSAARQPEQDVPSSRPESSNVQQPTSPGITRPAPGPMRAQWERAISEMTAAIKTKHYSPKTLRSYSHWIWKFQTFRKTVDPISLNPEDVKAFLSWLAVSCNVSASSQNQAFNALLFFFRHVLKKEFGEIHDVVRVKRRPYIPVVLTRDEVATVIKHLYPPYNLVVKTQYGCGLRLFECVKLRVHDFNFDDGILTVRGKGGKVRTVPLPQAILPELLAQLERVKKLHEQDLTSAYSGVFLDHLLEKKYKNAARELIWQWFFPQKTLTLVEGTNEKRRYHIHESHVQKAIRAAVFKAKLTKRVSSHTFRHSFATHLLQANYDIRTIQELLGHSDVRTTMIYTHCIPSRTVKEAKSPLDF